MGDFDFGFTEGPSEPDYDLEPGNMGRYEFHQRRQGFSPPFDKSPFSNPRGWHGGEVRQTGGHVMVREWATLPNGRLYLVHDKRPGREYEYEVAYGVNPGVSLNRYEWRGKQYRDGTGAYEFDGVVDEISVNENTDHAKAKAALKLMRKHSGKTR